MKALFCHDGPTYIDEKKQYFACVLTDELIDRYFEICNEFTLLNRLRKVDSVNGLEKLNHNNVSIVEIPNLATLKGILFDSKKAKKIIQEEVKKSDFVISRLPGFAGTYGIKYAKKYNKPYFVEVVGCPLDALSSHSLKGKLIAPIMYLVTKKSLKNSKYAIYVTNKFLQDRYPSKGHSIGCSDVDISIDENTYNERRERIETIKDDIILGTLGTLNMKYKGFDTVIKAISQINKENSHKYFYKIMGAGDEMWLKSIIKKYDAEEYVSIYKPVPHKDVFNWLDNEIDIYIQPSRTEGMPRALIEAMSRACPCIGSNAGGIPELLDKKYVFKKGNVVSLKNILQNVSKENLKLMSNMNFEKSKDFSKEKLDKKKKEFYKKFLKEVI